MSADGDVDPDVREELDGHVAWRVADNVARGMTDADARREAAQRFGALAAIARRGTRVRRAGHSWHRTLVVDLRHAIVGLGRSPLTPSIAVLVTAIGLATALSVARIGDALLVRVPPGVVRPGELYTSLEGVTRDGDATYPVLVSYAVFRAFAAAVPETTPFAWSRREMHVTTTASGHVAAGALVTGSYFEALGVRAAAGRLFDRQDDSGHHAVVAVSQRLAARLAADDPAPVVGREIRVNGRPFAIGGVASQGFRGLESGYPVDLWVPISFEPDISQPNIFPDGKRVQGFLNLPSIGWLRAGLRVPRDVPVDAVRARLTAALRSTPRPATAKPSTAYLVDRPWLSPFGGDRQPVTALVTPLAWAVALTLLLTSACLGSLFVGRLSDRQRDVGVRLALGAGRARVIRGVLIDVAVVVIVGAALSTLLSQAALAATSRLQVAAGIRVGDAVSGWIDWRLAGMTAIGAMLVAIAAAIAPWFSAIRLTRIAAPQSTRVTWSGNRFRRLLMMAQAAAGIALLATSVLLGRSVAGLRAQPLGYDAASVGFVELSPEGAGFDDTERQTLVTRLQNLTSTSGASIAVVSAVPYGEDFTSLFIAADDAAAGTQTYPITATYVAGPYFEMLRVPLLAGRPFTDGDRGRHVAIVSEPLAKYYWPGTSAVGRTLRRGGAKGTPVEIIGVVPGLRDGGLRGQPTWRVYFPMSVDADGLSVVVRDDRRAVAELVRDVAQSIRDIDDRLVIVRSGTLSSLAQRTLEQRQLLQWLTAGVAAGSLLMVVAGVWGLSHGSLRRRWREFGIRHALGGGRVHVARLAMSDALVVAVAGGILGALGGWQLARVFRGFLFGVAPFDPFSLAGATIVVALAAFAGAAVPVRRAMRVDAATLLRDDG